MWRNSAALILIALAGCDASVGNRTERSGEVKVTGFEEVGNNSSAPLEGVGAPAAWQVSEGTAFYGAADQPAQFAMRCDRAAQQVVFERADAGENMTISAGGVGTSLAARDVGKDRVQARTGLDDPVLAAMARSQVQIDIGGLIVPGGVAVRRVLDWCRRPPEPVATPETSPVAVPTLEPAPEPTT